MRARFTPPSQEEFEAKLRDLFDHGLITSVSALAKIHRTKLSRQLNPEEPEESIPYQYVHFLEACRASEGGEALKAAVERLVSRYAGHLTVDADGVEEDVQVAAIELQRAIVTRQSGETLKCVRALLPLLEGLERKFMFDGVEDSTEETGRLSKAG